VSDPQNLVRESIVMNTDGDERPVLARRAGTSAQFSGYGLQSADREDHQRRGNASANARRGVLA